MEVEQELSDLVRCYVSRLDQAAAEALVRRFQSMVAAPVARHIPSSDAEEICQEIFLDFFRNLSQLRDHSTVPGFLRQIALRRVCDYWRDRERSVAVDRNESPDTALSPTSSAEELTIARDRLRKLFAKLPARTRNIVRLAFIEDEPIRRIASILGISLISAKVEVFRVRKRLQ